MNALLRIIFISLLFSSPLLAQSSPCGKFAHEDIGDSQDYIPHDDKYCFIKDGIKVELNQTINRQTVFSSSLMKNITFFTLNGSSEVGILADEDIMYVMESGNESLSKLWLVTVIVDVVHDKINRGPSQARKDFNEHNTSENDDNNNYEQDQSENQSDSSND